MRTHEPQRKGRGTWVPCWWKPAGQGRNKRHTKERRIWNWRRETLIDRGTAQVFVSRVPFFFFFGPLASSQLGYRVVLDCSCSSSLAFFLFSHPSFALLDLAYSFYLLLVSFSSIFFLFCSRARFPCLHSWESGGIVSLAFSLPALSASDGGSGLRLNQSLI